ncbi:MAG: hypothetical protein JNN08_30800 [Bryobacterales bacterium]|nr:hypothetical protein [Bryobacterales bacterium]
MKLNDIERSLRSQLGLPEPRPSGARVERPTHDLEGLYRLLIDLRHEAELVGKIPVGYPRYVDVVMRVIHALLPWYTRPIERFSGIASRTVSELTEQVAQLIREQELNQRRIREMEIEIQDLRARLENR